jgi:predicted amino acid dehydrogenase/ribosome-associated toxin RatA of RatAB toxin-antitoxin module
MQDKTLIEIKLNRVISAEKWRVIRLLTRIQDFPDYIPCIKEARIIQRKRNVIQSRWRVQVNGVPISWTETDTLDFYHHTISFEAIEGDLAEFRGVWTLNDHPAGTAVEVKVYMRVGIPAISDFADHYVEKMLTRNFETILDSLERRLISIRYHNQEQGLSEKIAGFGIIGHLYNFYHLERSLKMLNPEFKLPSREFLDKIYHITPSFKLCDILNFKSRTGQPVNGCLVVATFIPDMIDRDVWVVFSKVVKACKLAEKNGVGIVTLGGFTSIVAERVGQEIASEVDVPVTTGNTFTAAMAIDGVQKAAAALGMDIAQAKVAVVGGTGDIGSACCRAFADRAKHVAATGRTKENLKKLHAELVKRHKAKITATMDNAEAVRDADIVIAAASASASILNIDWFKPGAIICDVGYPKNVSYMPTNREDILIFSGGLATCPTPLQLPIDVGLPSPNTIYGCFAEAIILALERRYERFSFGRGNITTEKIEEIRSLGKKHGFQPADFYWGNKAVDIPMLDKIRGFAHVR